MSFVTTSSIPTMHSTITKLSAPNLITRYNLQSKVNSKGKEKEDDSPPPGWASTKEQRQQMLQRRRDEMILAARRRLQEKDAENVPPAPT